MLKISVKDNINKQCLTKEDGKKIYNLIHGPLSNRIEVELTFEGITQFAEPFFNLAIGQFVKSNIESNLLRFLRISNLNDTGREIVCLTIRNSVKQINLSEKC